MNYYVFLVKETLTNGYIVNILNILSLLAILCGVFVIVNKNPVVSVLFLIGLFGNIACYLILIGLGFMGLVYLVVYIGAIWNGIIKPNWFNVVALVQLQLYGIFLIIIQIFQVVVSSLHLSPPIGDNDELPLKDSYNFFSHPCAAKKDYGKNSSQGFLHYSSPRETRVKVSPEKQLLQLTTKRFFSTRQSSNQVECGKTVGGELLGSDENFFKWFVGFSDGEGNFTIVFYKDKKGQIVSATFRFIIELHVDDIEVLNYIKSKLNIGANIAIYGNSCRFAVVHRKDILKLISIFDKYNLNTTKHLDYLDFKQAFILFNKYEDKDKSAASRLIDELLKLKNSMNSNRTNFNFPSDHKIVISDYWLLGFIEGEGSFYLERKDLRANFSIGLAEIQLPVIEKIKEFLESNLPFDQYSRFKLKNSSCFSINVSSNGENSKPFVRLIIRNTNVLTNYFIPYLNNLNFITKKSKDFHDFKIICTSLYNGTYRKDEIKSLLVKLSYSMNNFRLSTNTDVKKINEFSQYDLDRIINAKPTIIHLSDGRQVDCITKKEVNIRWTNCVYEIVNNLGEITLASSLNEAATILNVDFRTVKKKLEDETLNCKEGLGYAEINNKKVRRMPAFYPVSLQP